MKRTKISGLGSGPHSSNSRIGTQIIPKEQCCLSFIRRESNTSTYVSLFLMCKIIDYGKVLCISSDFLSTSKGFMRMHLIYKRLFLFGRVIKEKARAGYFIFVWPAVHLSVEYKFLSFILSYLEDLSQTCIL